MAAYYPRKVITFKDLQKAYPDFETWDEDEEDRTEAVRVYEHCPHTLYDQLLIASIEPNRKGKARQRRRGPQKVDCTREFLLSEYSC